MTLAAALLAELDEQALDDLARLLAPRIRALGEPPRADDGLLTVTSAARRAQAHPETLRRAIRKGDLRVAGHVGRSPRLAQEDLDAWLASGRRPTTRRPARPRGSSAARGNGSRPLAAAMATVAAERECT